MSKTSTKRAVHTPAMIERDNERFAKMTKPQKRVAIAKDALAAIKAKIYTAEEGTYCLIAGIDDPFGSEFDKSSQLRDSLAQCQCCAIGALFLSKARVADEETVGRYRRGVDYWRRLSPYFDRQQLDLIEAAFELHDVHDTLKEDARERAYRFGNRYTVAKNRLVAILNNIVENNGTFVP